MRYVHLIIALALGTALLLAGCEKEKTPKELPQPRPLLEEATAKVQNASSFQLEIEVNGYPVIIETGAYQLPIEVPLVFEYAKGTFVAPDRLQADVQISLGDLGETVQLVAIGAEQYMRSDLLTQKRWLKQEIIPGFSPASLMAPNGGLASALNSITNLEMVGEEDIEGLKFYHLRGQIAASNVYSLTFGLIGTTAGQIDTDIYIQPDEHRVEEVRLHEPLPEGVTDQDPTTWVIKLLDYNAEAAINPPELEVTEQP